MKTPLHLLRPALALAAALLLLLHAAYAQAGDTLPNPYRARPTPPGAKLYYTPGTGQIEGPNGLRIFNQSFVLMTPYADVPEVELGEFFDLLDTAGAAAADDAMNYRYNICTFNATGDLLYHPFWYDNGPDYWKEGRRRFVEGGKMGIVNRLGQRIVPARDYTLMSPVEGGFAIGCRDCKFTITDTADEEHGYDYPGTQYDVLDRDGHVVARLPPGLQSRDTARRQRRYADPQQVAKLAALLYALPETAGAAAARQMKKEEMRYVCYDEPTPASPWYHYGLEDTTEFMLWPDVQLLASPDGKELLFFTDHGLHWLIPYKEWRLLKDKF